MTTIRNPHLPYDETRWRPSSPETCARKFRFEEAEDAYAERDRLISRLDVYWCDVCEGWHIGKNECLPVEPQGTPAPVVPAPVVVMRMDQATLAGMDKQIARYKGQIIGINAASIRKSEEIRKLQLALEERNSEIEAKKERIKQLESQLKEITR